MKSSGGNEIPLIYAEVLQKIGVVLSADADELMKAPVRDTFKYHEVAQQFALINAGTLSGTAYDAWRIGQFNTRAQARKFKVEIDKINEEMPFNTRTLVL